VFVRDDARRMLIVEEAWNSIRDIGGGARSFQRKIALAEDVGVAIGGEAPYVPRGVWAVRATRGNRALVARFPEVLARFFPGSSRHWVDAILSGSEPPAEPDSSGATSPRQGFNRGGGATRPRRRRGPPRARDSAASGRRACRPESPRPRGSGTT